MIKLWAARFAAASTIATFLCSSLASQTTILSDEKTALRVEQQAVFEQMFDKPDDLDLMFRYAIVSIQLEDLEAAISTLERMLIYNREIPRAHMELGAAYYRLGSYKTASYYFDNVLAFTDVPPQVRSRAEEFKRAIDQRTQKSVFRGSVGAGVAYSSNANLGPEDSSVVLFGLPAVLQDEFVEEDDIGFKTQGAISHYYDLGQPDSDFWRTDLSFFTLHYADETSGDIDSVLLRTGPRLSIDDQQFGPKIRPFIEGDYLRSGNDALYSTISIGAEYTDTLSDTVSVFGTLRGGYRDFYNGRDNFDSVIIRGSGGVAYLPNQNIVLRAALFLERTDADSDENSNTEAVLRLSASHSYDSGFDLAEQLWSLTGFVSAGFRVFDEEDSVIVGAGGRNREDVDFRAGLRHQFNLMDGLWVAAEVDGLYRESNIVNFDLTNIGGALTVGLDF